jgi:hypothetical protein
MPKAEAVRREGPVHTPGCTTNDERRLVDISRSEQVETDLDRLIQRRHDQRVQTEGERAAEELWAESERRYFARQREDNRIAWCRYYRNVAGTLYARAEEYIVMAKKRERTDTTEGRGNTYWLNAPE